MLVWKILVCFVALLAILAIVLRMRSPKGDIESPTPLPSNPRESPDRDDKPILQVTDVGERDPEIESASEDLSHSGTVFVEGEIERCIEAQNWGEAVKWLTHAVASLPDRDDLKIMLLDVYRQLGDTEQCKTLFEELYIDLPESNDSRERLLRIARDAIPDHPVFKDTPN